MHIQWSDVLIILSFLVEILIGYAAVCFVVRLQQKISREKHAKCSDCVILSPDGRLNFKKKTGAFVTESGQTGIMVYGAEEDLFSSILSAEQMEGTSDRKD